MSEKMLLVLIAGIVLAIVILAFFVLLKKKEFTRKIKLLEEVIEKTTNDIHHLQKSLKENQEKNRVQSNLELESGLERFYREMRELHEMIKSDRNYFEEKMLKLENRVRDFGHLGGGSDVDEKRIITLYQEGWSIDSIAKELRIGRGEVEFTLKLADI